MPETDEFYNQCDRLGILVFQEWPTAWNSHETEPYEILEETVRLNTLRLRNHPSLALWGGGNESINPFGRAIDMMGRLSIELDGTRAFHRGEPWGGSLHDYASDWGRKPLDHNLHLRADFFGEFGMNSVPVYESVMRYLPDEEKKFWPPPYTGAFVHHTPVFNTRDCMERLRQFSGYFSDGSTLSDFIFGSQLAASTCTRHTLELARTRWPYCSGALYYKLNDNYPAASWACLDWYGAPKMTHFFNMDAFAPLAAPILFDSFENEDKPLDLDCWLLDDHDALKDHEWLVKIRVYHSDLHCASEKTFSGSGSIDSVRQLGAFSLTSAQTRSTPLLVTSEVIQQGQLAFRTFYWLNYEKEKDCLQHLPSVTLQLNIAGANQIEVSNTSSLAAVGVHVEQPGKAHLFQIDDNYFWLEPGETKSLCVNSVEGLVVKAWNGVFTPHGDRSD
jgi:beta-mannosidase